MIKLGVSLDELELLRLMLSQRLELLEDSLDGSEPGDCIQGTTKLIDQCSTLINKIVVLQEQKAVVNINGCGIPNLRKLRIQLGFSQGELADRAGLRQEMISDYEHGRNKPSLKNLIKLATSLNVGVNDLIEVSNAN